MDGTFELLKLLIFYATVLKRAIQDHAWGDVTLTTGAGVMMMGSTEGIPAGPPPPASTKEGTGASGSAVDDEVSVTLVRVVVSL